MFTKVGTVSVFVNDQERAKAFYVDKLGLELRNESELYPGASSKWLAVAPKGAQTEIILYLPDENWEHYKQTVGKSQAITLHVSDLSKTHANLKAKGVKFVTEPEKQFWGTFATIEDSEGNHILLVKEMNQ